MKQFRLDELAERLGGRCQGPPELKIRGVAGIREAQDGEISFLADLRYEEYLDNTGASAIICGEEVETSLPSIRVKNPKLSFLLTIEAFSQPQENLFPEGIHASAVIDSSAELGAGVRVGATSVIGRDCLVGEGTVVGPGVVLMDGARVGARCLLYPKVVVREACTLGDRVIIHSGAVVGSDGFGYVPQEGGYRKIPQIGRVVVEDDVEIGANTCIDRATTGITVIGAGSKLDNLVQVAHNVIIGRGSAISAQSGISGSSEIGEGVILGGQVGVSGHLRLGDRVKVGAQSGIARSVPDDAEMFGSPAQDLRTVGRLLVHYNRLPRYAREIDDLKRRLESLEKSQVAPPSANSEETS